MDILAYILCKYILVNEQVPRALYENHPRVYSFILNSLINHDFAVTKSMQSLV